MYKDVRQLIPLNSHEDGELGNHHIEQQKLTQHDAKKRQVPSEDSQVVCHGKRLGWASAVCHVVLSCFCVF